MRFVGTNSSPYILILLQYKKCSARKETFKLLQCIIMAPVIFTDYSKAVLILLLRLWSPVGKGLPLGSPVCDVFLYFYHFPYGVPDQV